MIIKAEEKVEAEVYHFFRGDVGYERTYITTPEFWKYQILLCCTTFNQSFISCYIAYPYGVDDEIDEDCMYMMERLYATDASTESKSTVLRSFPIDLEYDSWCYVDQSQLSFTAAMALTAQGTKNLCSTENVKENRKNASHQATAVQAIASLWKYTSLDQNCGIQMLKKGVLCLPWIKDKSEKASLLDVIEPFWSSKYTQREGNE